MMVLRIPTDRGLGGNRGRLTEAASRGLLGLLFKAEYAYDMGMPQWAARLDHVLSPLRLAVGSRRAPKLDAVHAAATSLLATLRVGGLPFDSYSIWSDEVDSGVEETPLSLESLVAGARERARVSFERASGQGFAPHFGLGLEGGAVRGADRRLFLQPFGNFDGIVAMALHTQW